jgi:hypothetical protein
VYQGYWQGRAGWRPESWALSFGVFLDGAGRIPGPGAFVWPDTVATAMEVSSVRHVITFTDRVPVAQAR